MLALLLLVIASLDTTLHYTVGQRFGHSVPLIVIPDLLCHHLLYLPIIYILMPQKI